MPERTALDHRHAAARASLLLAATALLLGCSVAAREPANERTGDTTADNASNGTAIVDAKPLGNETPTETHHANTPEGVLTFRGNATRTYHGTGPIGSSPSTAWRYPDKPMCGKSSEYGETRTWCGTGWAGQPVVFEREGRTWVAFGAYDHRFHFLDAETGEKIIEPVQTGDLAKGMLTVDPDGYPLVYGGSRDNKFRVIAIDGGQARTLWELDGRAFTERKWNNDWDAAALVHDGHLIITGENGRIHAVRINRAYDADGNVTADPELVWSEKGWDDQLLRELGDERVSIESSPTMIGDTVYFANSGGLVQGWDLGPLHHGGTPRQTFRFWLGDDADATLVADDEGNLYAAVEVDRGTETGKRVGQLVKLDPANTANPVVWSLQANRGKDSGSWATPALWRDLVIFTTKQGEIRAVERRTGTTAWTLGVGTHTISSPTVVGDVLVQGDGAGKLRAWLLRPEGPAQAWTLQLGANIESSPAVWEGSIYVGSRDGFFYKVTTG